MPLAAFAFFQNLEKNSEAPQQPKRSPAKPKAPSAAFIRKQNTLARNVGAVENKGGSAAKIPPIVEDSVVDHGDSFNNIPCPVCLLIGQTGGGKSAIANAILGEYTCAESAKLDSCTSDIKIVSGRWYGTKEVTTVVDTPGFLDSENRDKEFLADIVTFLGRFPKKKLAVVVVTLPLTELRAKSTYLQMLDQIELLFGEQIWNHTIFVTTQENQLKISKEVLDMKKREWETWLKKKACIPHPKICNFLMDVPESIDAIRSLQLSSVPTTPQTSAQIHTFMEGNQGARVADVIANVNNLKTMQVNWEESMKTAIAEKERYMHRERALNSTNSRLQAQVGSMNSEIVTLRQKLAAPIPVKEVHHHHHHCCFPFNSTVVKEGEECPVPIESIVEGDKVLSLDENGVPVYSEVYFSYGKAVSAKFYQVFYKTTSGSEESIQLTADHIIFVSEKANVDILSIDSIVAEKLIAKQHYIWIREEGNIMTRHVVTKVNINDDFGLQTVLVKHHKLLVDSVLVSAYEISHSWGIIDTIPMRILYRISPTFVASSFNKKFCALYDRIVEGSIKTVRSCFRAIWC